MDKVWCVSWGADYEGTYDWKLFQHQADAFVFANEKRKELDNDMNRWRMRDPTNIGYYHWASRGGDHVIVEAQEIN